MIFPQRQTYPFSHFHIKCSRFVRHVKRKEITFPSIEINKPKKKKKKTQQQQGMQNQNIVPNIFVYFNPRKILKPLHLQKLVRKGALAITLSNDVS